MDNLQIFKEKMINDYLSSIDISNTGVDEIKRELRIKLGEEPAIKLNYVKSDLILENGVNSGKQIETLESMTIIFTVEREIMPGQSIPLPVTRTFLI